MVLMVLRLIDLVHCIDLSVVTGKVCYIQCTEGWDCDLGFQGLNFFLAIMVWVASWDPTGRYSTLEPSVGTFRGSL